MNAYPVDYQLDVLQVRAFGVHTGLVMPVFRQGKRESFLSNTDNTYLNSEHLGDRSDARRAIFDVYIKNSSFGFRL